MRYILTVVLVAAGCTSSSPSSSGPDMATPDLTPVWPSGCMSGSMDGDETDIDCGGSCPPCDTGKRCIGAKDCTSGLCVNRACAAPACNDMVKNGDESDVDCGGSCPTKCADNKMCARGADCSSGMCVNQVCKSNCPAGTGNCDGVAGNGCETNTDTDVKNCGRCGNACPVNAPFCAGGLCTAASPIGSFLVEEGRIFSDDPPTMTCQETCASLFGGVAANYSCSTVMGSVNHMAWADGYGDASHCGPSGTPVAENYKKGAHYLCLQQGCSYSAYVRDNCRTDAGRTSRNYCFK